MEHLEGAAWVQDSPGAVQQVGVVGVAVVGVVVMVLVVDPFLRW